MNAEAPAELQLEPRRHPDVFTAAEAALYLHLETTATLDWLRDQKLLTGHKIGKGYMYHRAHLDACAARMFGTGTA